MRQWWRRVRRGPQQSTAVDLWIDSAGLTDGEPLGQAGQCPGWQRRTFLRVRDRCVALLADLDVDGEGDVAARVAAARNLSELWHLRPCIYGEVARLRCEAEARRRLREIDVWVPRPYGR